MGEKVQRKYLPERFSGIDYVRVGAETIKHYIRYFSKFKLRKLICNTTMEKYGQLESGMSWKNGLKTLDLSNNPLLAELDCSYNQLTELDLTNNPKLQKLHCDGNKISTVNLYSNALLKELYCDHNKLKALDLYGKERMMKCPCRIKKII